MKARIIKKVNRHVCMHVLRADVNPLDVAVGDIALCTCGKQFILTEGRLGSSKFWKDLKEEEYVPEGEWLPS